MNELSSDECLQKFISSQMRIFQKSMDRAVSDPVREGTLCDQLVFLKRFGLLSETARRVLGQDNFPSKLINIAGNVVSIVTRSHQD